MKLFQLLLQDRIVLDFEASDREHLIKHMASELQTIGVLEHADQIVEMVMAREKQVGTGIGYGVAIPHSDPGPFSHPVVAFCRLKNAIDFNAPDGNKARLIFLLLTPEKTPALHVRLLARICRLLKSENLRNQLLTATHPNQVSDAITVAETDFPELNP